MVDKNMDFTHLSEDEKINGIKITNVPQYIREKAYLTDFSETLAQLAEMIIQLGVNLSLDPDEALEWARKLQESISQSEFDSWVATLLDGGPSIFMNTLSELQTTYPNGAPGVALVRETDPAKIYVWNGSVWEDFGDYQGIDVKNNSVGTEKLKDEAVTVEKTDFLRKSVNLFDKLKVVKGYALTRTGEPNANELWNYFELNVKGGQTYTASHAINTWLLVYDANGNRLPTPADVTMTPTVQSYTMPSNAAKVFLNVRNSVIETYMFVEGSVLPTSYVPYYKKIEGLTLEEGTVTEEMTTFFEISENLFDKNKLIHGKYFSKYLDYVDSSVWGYYPIDVDGNETYTISHAYGTWIAVFDETGTVISPLPADVAYSATVVTYKMPANAKSVILNVRNEFKDEYMFVKGSTLPTEYIPYYKRIEGVTLEDNSVTLNTLSADLQTQLDNSQNKWFGKNGVSFGDSITYYDGKAFSASTLFSGQIAVGYQSYLREAFGVTIDNQGVSGNHLNQILTKIKAYDFSSSDFATITSGANDWTQERAIGSLAMPKSSFDENTFYGALQSAVEFIINANADTKIILITPVRGYHPTSTHTGEWLNKGRVVNGMLEQPEDYAIAIKEVAELYGLEYIDFRSFTGLNFMTMAQLLGDDITKTSGKYVHPNNDYYEKMGLYAVERFKQIAVK